MKEVSSMWWCKDCEAWNGTQLSACLDCERQRPLLPVTSDNVTEVLDLARAHQTPRVTSKVTSVTFTEYWFRNSGLYDLNRDGVDEYAKPDEDER